MEPNANGKLAAYFKPDQKRITRNDALYYASVLIGLKVVHTFYHENYNIYLQELAIQIRTSLSSLIYNKSLKLSPEGSASVSLGKVVTILSKDASVFEHSMVALNEFWIAILEGIFLTYLIYMKVGISCVGGIGVCLIVLIVQRKY